MARQRCICGRSSRMPLCDGAHRSEGWSCRPAAAPRVRWAFAASPHYVNLAERLAHELGGVVSGPGAGSVEAEEVVAICQAADSGSIMGLRNVRAETRRLLVVGGSGLHLAPEVVDWPRVTVPDGAGPHELWRNVLAALEVPGVAAQVGPPPSVFLSHAVADEDRIAACVDSLRSLGARVFTCGDSIRSGDDWRWRIIEELRAAERVLVVASAASRESVWCAFEVGLAEGYGKPIDIVSLDGSPPPSFIGHLQMADLPRLRARQPWLDEEESFVEAVLGIWSEAS